MSRARKTMWNATPVERDVVRRVLRAARGLAPAAAHALGISRTTLFRWVRALGLGADLAALRAEFRQPGPRHRPGRAPAPWSPARRARFDHARALRRNGIAP